MHRTVRAPQRDGGPRTNSELNGDRLSLMLVARWQDGWELVLKKHLVALLTCTSEDLRQMAVKELLLGLHEESLGTALSP